LYIDRYSFFECLLYRVHFIECCSLIYNALSPLNIDGICYIGIDDVITRRYLKEKGIIGKDNFNNREFIESKKVRYLGNSVAAILDNDDKMCFHFFTSDMESDLSKCSVDYYIDLKESEIIDIVNRVYEKKKNDPIELGDINNETLSNKILKALNKKIYCFRYGEVITVSLIRDKIVAINDFYPKAKIYTSDEALILIDIIINKIESTKSKGYSIDENIMASGYEVMNKIIRFTNIRFMDKENKSSVLKVKFNLFDELEDLFVELSYIYLQYINNKLSTKEAINESMILFKQMYSYIGIMKELREEIENENENSIERYKRLNNKESL
uniref:hypothetical protein n=1 Tax=Clostridium sp. 1001271B_151109_B4 TaxID=2787148 RepID=UPI0018AA7B6B